MMSTPLAEEAEEDRVMRPFGGNEKLLKRVDNKGQIWAGMMATGSKAQLESAEGRSMVVRTLAVMPLLLLTRVSSSSDCHVNLG